MTMQGRNYSADNYRFGYQGSEKEVGVAGMYTTEYRALDVRLGRWFTPDPITQPWQSPYCSMDNNPIALTDVMGLDPGGPGGTGTQTGSGDGYMTADLPEVDISPRTESLNFNFDFSQSANEAAIVSFPVTPRANSSSTKGIVNGSSPTGQILAIPGNNVEFSDYEPRNARFDAYMAGVLNAVISNCMMTIGSVDPDNFSNDPVLNYYYAKGKMAGDRISMVIGAGESADAIITAGVTTGAIGVEAATVVGAPAVVPTAIGGYLVAAIQAGHGIATVAIANANYVEMQAYVRSYEMSGAEKTTHNNASDGGGSGDLKYSPTKKHEKGGWGTEMDLDNATAQDVLDNSVQSGKQRYGVHNDKIYEFQPDNVGGWHGYPIKGTEAPSSVLKGFKDSGRISPAQYKKLIKGK